MAVFPRPGNASMPNNRASNGGRLTTKEISNYKPPKGPSSINNPKTPGLHGSNHGNCGTQGKR